MSHDPFDLVREWFAAYNRDDLDVARESLWADGVARAGRRRSRRAATAFARCWRRLFRGVAARRSRAASAVASAMIGRIESGHDARRVDRARAARRRPVPFASARGYSRFRHRGRAPSRAARGGRTPVDCRRRRLPPPEARRSSRRYPPRPVVGVGAVIVDEGRVVLIKRKYEPLAGQWSLPGGTLDIGESLEAGVAREMREETGLEVARRPGRRGVRSDPARHGRPRPLSLRADRLPVPADWRHLQAGSDVADAVLADPDELAPFRLTPKGLSR